MLAEAYTTAWLQSRTIPADWGFVARRRGRVHLRFAALQKAVIRTPMAGGRVDYDAVPVGASIWVTVKDESSPLHGRPILITKRPDGLFALEGGSGFSHWHDDKRVAARKHLVLAAGAPQSTTADKAMAGKLAERDEKKEQYREQVRAQHESRRVASGEARKAFGLPADVTFSKADNLRHRDRVEKLFLDGGAEPQEARVFAGSVVREFNAMTKRFMGYVKLRRAMKAHEVVGGPMLEVADAEGAQDPNATFASDPAHELNVDVQAMVDDLLKKNAEKKKRTKKSLTPQEAEMAAQAAGDDQVDASLEGMDGEAPDPEDPAAEPDEGDIVGGGPGDSVFSNDSVNPSADTVDFDATADEQAAAPAPPPPAPKPPPFTLAKAEAWEAKDFDAAKQSLDAFRREHLARAGAATIKQDLEQYKDLRLISPTAVDRQTLAADGLSDADFDDLMEHYRRIAQTPPAGAFYQAVGEHWNDDIPYADGLGGYAEKGAVSAITGLLGDSGGLDARIDVGGVVRRLGIEGAAYALAGDIIAEHGKVPGKIDDLITKLTNYNAHNQRTAEDKALTRHGELQRQGVLIEKMIDSGDLAVDDVPEGEEAPNLRNVPSAALKAIQARANAEGTRLLSENIAAQRENLGVALGSLQMSATILHALESTRKMAGSKNPQAKWVRLFFGDNKEGRNEALKSLKVGSGALVADHDLRMGHYIDVDTTRLKRYIGKMKSDHARNQDWEETKSSTKGVKEVGGQEVVPDYKVPFFKDTFTDTDGQEKPSLFRKNQRNDIEWLRKSGGGVITRTTGAGKTNTTLGYYAHQIAENSHYHGVAVVPNKRGDQWAKEANNFTTLRTHAVPDDATASQLDEHLREYAASPGGVLIIGHKQAARAADKLQQMYEAGKLHGMTIDEPQEMMGKSKFAKLTGGAQALMKVGAQAQTTTTKKGEQRIVRRPDPKFNRVALTATPAKREAVQAYDLVNWTNPKQLGPRVKFRSAFSGYGEGTNAADDALANMVGKEVGPYVSGDEEVKHPFQLKVEEHLVRRTEAQRGRQRAIEGTSKTDVADLTQSKYEALRRNPTNASKAKKDLMAEARDGARRTIAERHRENLDSGDYSEDEKGGKRLLNPSQAAKDNGKIQEMLRTIRENPRGQKHVIFINGKLQRAAVMAGLKDEGYSSNAVKNMTEGSPADVEAKKQAWKQGGPDVPFLLIDRHSASGHNLQEGDHLHVLAAPDDAAQMLQAQGRIARGNKRSDTTVHTYKTHDSPFETASWEQIDRGMKLMAATSPGLAKKFLKKVTQARDAALQGWSDGEGDDGDDIPEQTDEEALGNVSRFTSRDPEPGDEDMVAKSMNEPSLNLILSPRPWAGQYPFLLRKSQRPDNDVNESFEARRARQATEAPSAAPSISTGQPERPAGGGLSEQTTVASAAAAPKLLNMPAPPKPFHEMTHNDLAMHYHENVAGAAHPDADRPYFMPPPVALPPRDTAQYHADIRRYRRDQNLPRLKQYPDLQLFQGAGGIRRHREIVEQAIANGESVPDRVQRSQPATMNPAKVAAYQGREHYKLTPKDYVHLRADEAFKNGFKGHIHPNAEENVKPWHGRYVNYAVKAGRADDVPTNILKMHAADHPAVAKALAKREGAAAAAEAVAKGPDRRSKEIRDAEGRAGNNKGKQLGARMRRVSTTAAEASATAADKGQDAPAAAAANPVAPPKPRNPSGRLAAKLKREAAAAAEQEAARKKLEQGKARADKREATRVASMSPTQKAAETRAKKAEAAKAAAADQEKARLAALSPQARGAMAREAARRQVKEAEAKKAAARQAKLDAREQARKATLTPAQKAAETRAAKAAAPVAPRRGRPAKAAPPPVEAKAAAARAKMRQTVAAAAPPAPKKKVVRRP